MLIFTLFLLVGCKSSYLVRNASVSNIISSFKDYAGVHGYQITYQNDATGSYRLNMGNVYVPEVSRTVKTTTVIATPAKDSYQPMTAYEETTWLTVSNPGHYVVATAMVSITQQGDNVLIVLDGNDVAGVQLNDVYDYFEGLGYVIEKK
ncbi:MAG: hypothetical protein KKB81_00045 [Candidatus Margulisbacteria bacterium]|nr:hypothetical protein [Candidatus Margulisiibacteriota bacterium]MBU1022345.1 hypothetical protein [Candidatus Margulisiibacteriota bacterium]MBU1729103.1 hypothetical protein [Candidatus Margulisiibacteriota bacterium]MBU1954476.1 hypothetical protein [Candidatus Margulisiibacteriota bacterium]